MIECFAAVSAFPEPIPALPGSEKFQVIAEHTLKITTAFYEIELLHVLLQNLFNCQAGKNGIINWKLIMKITNNLFKEVTKEY